ncbi:MAG: bifunctional fucokinase/fucose-1-phosphate guanylyltransferase [Bacteroides sp.]|nr:bifunctional fucokinase/fucose-1-phosphate guanylyltransferase [Bacteroides sp.]MCM1413373.1 bifunctional fucokinase/fucose-1-phosphate guanylyltransferase [Bacteroides sp.]MCM1471941.1 bifunctional fucokinase/fucose-1-phosphate guanylyltransferase [Bacteroides sp.]
MYKLLSLPQNIVDSFRKLDPAFASPEWFATADPVDCRLGSGGGTTWLLNQWEKTNPDADRSEKRIIIHGGGQGRRLPAYASSGKLLTPIPVLRWATGQHLDQNLLQMQLPLYESIMSRTASDQNTLIASGDVLLRAGEPINEVPQADVVCYGIWAEPHQASHHGVFMLRRDDPHRLDYMLQKPEVATLNDLSTTHYYMMDIGLWILSDRAVELLRRRSTNLNNGKLKRYDLYSEFGCALGNNPTIIDPELNSLSVAVVALPKGEFYHFGTTRELLQSTLSLQNRVVDQRRILLNKAKPHPSIFTQNALISYTFTADNRDIWIENSVVSDKWQLTQCNVVTGVPDNDWDLMLVPGVCLDIQPVGEGSDMVVHVYGYDDAMRGLLSDDSTLFMGRPVTQWFADRKIEMLPDCDIQSAPLFPVTSDMHQTEVLAKWMTGSEITDEGRDLWLKLPRLSADEISARVSLPRMFASRRRFMEQNISTLARNHERSVFYQLDLDHLCHLANDMDTPLPDVLPDDANLINRMRNRMLRATALNLKGDPRSKEEERHAFELLSGGILSTLDTSSANPRLDVYRDQIVWGRSPVRIDLAGGWTDTPPYSVVCGGNVVNTAIELNGQPPLQVFVKSCTEPHIIIRSIDLGASETVVDYDQLTDYNKVGSPFSLPKAALSLCGFAPQFCPERYPSLRDQLKAFGSGIEITLLSAIPAGSGLGTSSILAATVIAALADFCSLAWDTSELCRRTLALEQILTSGGGWQDQYGGILQGTKLLQTSPGWNQEPRINWLPDGIFTDAATATCHLLYYTGITRTAKSILAEIVKRMYLNSSENLELLDSMRNHAVDMARAIQRRDFDEYGRLLARTWQQNCRLDSGTNPPSVQAIIDRVSDLLLGYKLPGAGGGGYLYMVAKDAEAASKVKKILQSDPVNSCARFVDMSISTTGLQVSRS